MRKQYIITLFFLLPLLAAAQINHWESVILPGDEWHYLLPEEQPSPTWTNADFTVDSWQIGASGFGYGDGDDATEIPVGSISVYLRKEFEIVNSAEIEMLLLDMDFDDGFVAYLNGVEIARAFVLGNPPAFNQASDGLHEAMLYQGLRPDRYEIDHTLLLDGTNVLAIEVHNESTTSSDLSAIPVLSVGVNTTSNHYRPAPDWFLAPSTIEFTSSNFPIVVIETNGVGIPDEPKIDATMQIISRETGERNFLTDKDIPENLDFSGNIKIEVRGSSSQILPKKQYGFTTYDQILEKENVSLLGMPKENDWILNGLAFDPSLIRDFLSYNLFWKMGHYTTRTHYCEVVLNGEYQGLYILQEKMKADDNRIDINKIKPGDNVLPKLSGGYVTKADRPKEDPVAWDMPNYGGWITEFVHVTPKPEEADLAQTEYIQGEFFRLAATASDGNASLVDGYPSVIDMPSFIDFMLINELSANVDAYQLSTYFHKDRNGKLRAGPIWDLNLTYGNDLFFWGFDRSHTNIWQFDDGDNVGPEFWKDLFDHDVYRCYMAKRWNELTQPGQPLNLENINTYIDQIVEDISEAVVREEDRWRTVGDHTGHVNGIKSFLEQRIAWMTSQLGPFASCSDVQVPALAITKIHYNPAPFGDISGSDQEFIEVTNIGTSTADLTGVYIGGTGLVYQFPPNSKLSAGRSLFLANEAAVFREVYGFSPFDEFSRSLNNSGQTIRFLDGFGNVIDEVSYTAEAPWPVSAFGDGNYLEIIDLNADNNDPTNWKAISPDELEVILGTEGPQPVLVLYPNPTGDKLQITASSSIESLVLFDQQGKVVATAYTHNKAYELDITGLSQGIYIMAIQTSQGRFTRKVKKE